MLTLLHDGVGYPIQDDTYYRTEKADGMDSLTFSMSIRDELYPLISEQENVLDEDGNRWLIKKIDGGSKSAKIVAEIDLDEWRENMYLAYDSGSNTVANLLSSIAPTGWAVYDKSGSSIRRTISGDAYTALEIAQEAMTTYSVYLRFDTSRKAVTIYTQTAGEPTGSFATRDLNLKEINYKGDSSDFATRLYAYGKDGLTFSSINDGKEYVDDHSYSDRVISAYWKDERYTDVESLLSAAKEKLHELANPVRSYECSIVDLQATNPELYNNLDFSLFTVALLVDDAKKSSVLYQVIEREVHPNYPAENVVTFSTTAATITKSVLQITNEVQNPNSDFNQQRAIAIANATNWLTSADGYVVAVKDTDGSWKELLFMDTNDMATAKNVLRINTNGIGFSTTGANGPFTNAWTIDGSLVASFITSGEMSANRVRLGLLTDYNGSNYWNLSTGEFSLQSTAKIGGKTVAEIAQSAVDAQTQISIFNRLTNNGATQGIYLSGGKVYINASYVATGILKDTSGNTTWNLATGALSSKKLSIASTNFTLTEAGVITAKSGTIGGFAITSTSIQNAKTGLGVSKGDGVYVGTDGIAVGNNSGWDGSPVLQVGHASGFNYVGVSLLSFYRKGGNTCGSFSWKEEKGSDWLGWNQNLYVSNYISCMDIDIRANSDERLKEDIEPLPVDESKRLILNVAPRRYRFKKRPETLRHGLIAQDVLQYTSDDALVHEDQESGMYGLNYFDVIADLINVVQDQERRIKVLEEALNAVNNS